jgi:hypothetical protein
VLSRAKKRVLAQLGDAKLTNRELKHLLSQPSLLDEVPQRKVVVAPPSP